MSETSSRGKLKFVVDAMLKNIVSWLRILGYDVVYCGGEDEEVLRIAREDDRIILTMDRGLALTSLRRGLKVMLITENDVSNILAKLAMKYGISLDFDAKNTRCPVCNHELYLAKTGERDEWICLNCGKKYWKGSHWRNISKTIEAAKRKLMEEASKPKS